jgi:hypothetical protein
MTDNIFSASFPEINESVLSEISNFKIRNLGGGVVVIENALNIDKDILSKASFWIDRNAQQAHEQRWTYEKDEAGNVYALNEDKNKFSLEQLKEVPVRVLQPVTENTEKEMADLFRYWEDQIYKCLIRYVDEFPMALPTLWWRSRGHIIRYEEGMYLGIHNDNDSNYRSTGGQRFVPKGQMQIRQVVAVSAYINDCVNLDSKLDGTNYTGGELFFPYLNLEYSPKMGDVVIFPCNFYATHGVKTVKSGVRYGYLEFISQGSSDENVLVFIKEPAECEDWCYPHWMDNLFDDYKRYCLYSEYDKDKNQLHKKPNPLYQNRTLEGDEGLRKAYDHKKVISDNQLRGKLTLQDADKI